MTYKPCVLVADDDPDEVYLLRWAFHRAGINHELIELRDGALTVDYLKGIEPYDDRACYPLPELLMLDLKMPRMNGFDVLAWLNGRPELKHLPAIVFSSSD